MRSRASWSQLLGLGALWVLRGTPEENVAEQISSVSTPKLEVIATEAVAKIEAPSAASSNTPSLMIQTSAKVIESATPEKHTWESLPEAIRNCQRCALYKTRNNPVFGRGNASARWLLIGEAPGANEDKQGLAFVGRSGQLLDNMLAAIGLDTNRDVFITNVLKCRPPANRNPSGEEIIACQTFLHAQIAHLKPTLIMAFGRFAAQTLLQTEQHISQLRQKQHEYHGIPLIVTFHPAYLLRNQPDKAKAWQDLLFALRSARQIKTPALSD